MNFRLKAEASEGGSYGETARFVASGCSRKTEDYGNP
jgi:hypothetical protein